MTANEIVAKLREHSQDYVAYKMGSEYAEAVTQAADIIERLQNELDAATRRGKINDE